MMNALSISADVLGSILHYIAVGVQAFLEFNYYSVSVLISATHLLTKSFLEATAYISEILECYYYDFIDFCNELGSGIRIVLTAVLTLLSKGLFHITFATCYCLDTFHSAYIEIIIFVKYSSDLVVQMTENITYFTTVFFHAILLILQLGPNLFILFWQSIVFGSQHAIDCVCILTSFIIDYVYCLPSMCQNMIYSIPPKAYIGILLFIILFYSRKTIFCYLRFHFTFILQFSFVKLLQMFAIIKKCLLVSCIPVKYVIQLLRYYRRRSISEEATSSTTTEIHVQMNQSRSRLKIIYESLKKNINFVSIPFQSLKDKFGVEEVEKLQKELTAEKDRHVCVICHDREKNIILFPCRHMCMCEECTLELQASFQGCPLCRRTILNTLHVYT